MGIPWCVASASPWRTAYLPRYGWDWAVDEVVCLNGWGAHNGVWGMSGHHAWQIIGNCRAHDEVDNIIHVCLPLTVYNGTRPRSGTFWCIRRYVVGLCAYRQSPAWGAIDALRVRLGV